MHEPDIDFGMLNLDCHLPRAIVPLEDVNHVRLPCATETVVRLIAESLVRELTEEDLEAATICQRGTRDDDGCLRACTVPRTIPHSIHVAHGMDNEPVLAWMYI